METQKSDNGQYVPLGIETHLLRMYAGIPLAHIGNNRSPKERLDAMREEARKFYYGHIVGKYSEKEVKRFDWLTEDSETKEEVREFLVLCDTRIPPETIDEILEDKECVLN